MSTGKIVRLLKLFLAIVLLPACIATTLSAWQLGRALAFGPHALPLTLAGAFCAGYALWLAIFAILPRPVRTYVLGHELTHALWALMMGARVSGLKVRKTGGQVRTSKTNWAITLAPYFFPFYAMLFIALFFLANAFWELERHTYVLFFLVGLGWSFHVTFTLMTLLQVRQPDIQSQGKLFSFVVIYCMNLLTITLTIVLLSRTVSLAVMGQVLGQNMVVSYGWTLDKLDALWHYATTFLSRTRQS